MESLIGLSLDEAKNRLEQKNMPYEILTTVGGKDEEILIEQYVVRQHQEGQRIILVTTGFFTGLS